MQNLCRERDRAVAIESETAAPSTPDEAARAEAGCRRCSLCRDATEVVSGAGAAHAGLALAGKEPGDHEDIAGKPFVGPAGRVLDYGIAGGEIFLTNAVKQFKHEQRGKRRLHKRPSIDEIERCRWWLDLVSRPVRPGVIAAMEATAVRGVFGRSAGIAAARRYWHVAQTLRAFLGGRVGGDFATPHPR